ncbi:hypothetical protein CANARDRAFT_26744 [[Candida] arabinofermentans NRRL YB-2248]|uniref:Uncharacterized protein n=1 Tax=[Candida] arabinofermentans NRRL YB-2248 TaxID=983967 RepID=A0A1E4T6P4_9ASCO|nr:hypothetical protein CANARDRAFT_26744 [[Candida] arabinofermentans NRRL YB-2248]
MEHNTHYIEQTVFASNMVRFYFNNFKVRVHHKDNFLAYAERQQVPYRYKRLLTTSTWQELTEPTDSMDPFSGDEEEFNEILQRSTTKKDTDVEMRDLNEEDDDLSDSQLVPVNIFIKCTSMSINDKSCHSFLSPVMSAAVLEGNNQSKHEDSLLVTLSCGDLLLIRIVLINNCFEPVVLQRINLHRDQNKSKLIQLGRSISTFKLGHLIAIAAYSKVIRLSKVTYCKDGIPAIGESLNLITGGVIVQSCFLEPVDQNHIMFLNLVSTESSILQLECSEFYLNKEMENDIHRSVLMLPNTFEIPYFMIPLRETQCVLFVQESKCIINGMNYLISHDGVDYAELPLTVGLAQDPIQVNAYYMPSTMISCYPCEEYDDPNIRFDQILLSSTSPPTLWLLEVFYDTKKPEWYMRIGKLFTQPTIFSQFSMEETGFLTYDLAYMNEKGSTDFKTISLVARGGDRKYFSMRIIEDRGSTINWFPTFDFAIVNSAKPKFVNSTSSQEFWCIGRSSKRGALINLRKGYSAEKSKPISKFKGAEKIFRVNFQNGDTKFILSYPFMSIMIKLPKNNSDSQSEDFDSINEAEIIDEFTIDQKTLLVTKLKNGKYIQILQNGWRIGDFEVAEELAVTSIPFEITLASVAGNHVSICYDYTIDCLTQSNIEILEILADAEGYTITPMRIPKIQGLQCSMIELLTRGSFIDLAVGTFAYEVIFYRLSTGNTFEHRSVLDCKEYADEKAHSCHIPHQLVDVNEGKFLLTTRDGYILMVTHELEKFRKVFQAKLGETVIEIIESSKDIYYLITKAMWKLDLNSSMYPEKVCISETTDRSCTSGVIIPSLENEFSAEKPDDELLVIRDDGLCSLFVSHIVECNVKKVGLGATPLRLMYYSSYCLFVVIVAVEKELENKILFVDHKIKKVLQASAPSNLVAAGEYPICMSEWQVESRRQEGYTHNHLLLGFRTREGSGAVKIVEIKKQKDVVNLRVLNFWQELLPVTCITQLSDSTIIYGSGRSIMLTRYLPQESKMSGAETVYTFISDVIGLTVLKDNSVIAVTSQDSYQRFQYDGTHLTIVLSDSGSKSLLKDIVVHEDERGTRLIVGDKEDNSISSVALTTGDDCFDSRGTRAKVTVPFLPRIKNCHFFPIWGETTEAHHNKFIAVGLNGEVKLFTSVTESQFELLKDLSTRLIGSNKGKKVLKLSELSPSVEYNTENDFNFLNVDMISANLSKLQEYNDGDAAEISKMLSLSLI